MRRTAALTSSGMGLPACGRAYARKLPTTRSRRFTSSRMMPTNSLGACSCARSALAAVAIFFEELRGALDRAERVLDLVREARGHRAERGEAIALLHLRVDAAVGDGDADLRGDGLEQRDLLGRERVAHARVGDADEADERVLGVVAAEARTTERLSGAERCSAAVSTGTSASPALARELLERDREPASAEAIEQRPRGERSRCGCGMRARSGEPSVGRVASPMLPKRS